MVSVCFRIFPDASWISWKALDFLGDALLDPLQCLHVAFFR